MKAAVVKENSKVEIENFDISEIKPNELLIKMQSCGICGSESLQQVRLKAKPVTNHFDVSHEAVNQAVEQLSNKQPLQNSTGARIFATSLKNIEIDLGLQVNYFLDTQRPLEAKRLKERTNFGIFLKKETLKCF